MHPLLIFLLLLLPSTAFAQHAEFTDHWAGLMSLGIFILAYILVMAEEFTHLRKSKPVVLAAGIIWVCVSVAANHIGMEEDAHEALNHNLMEFGELFLFLLVAMTYINAMEDRQVFKVLRNSLINRGYGFRKLFWMTGFFAFLLSPMADNLTTALVMGAVVMSVGQGNPRFIALGCINIVVAANAGGAFSPFGDITTLMVWQKGMVHFWDFFRLFVPSLVNFVVPAAIMHFAIPDEHPVTEAKHIDLKPGGRTIVLLFLATIATAVCFYNFFHIKPMLGMMTGLGYLMFFGYVLRRREIRMSDAQGLDGNATVRGEDRDDFFDIFHRIARAEWDTLLFFYGVILSVGGLGFAGYLALASELMYVDLGATSANILVGLMSSIVDNIPVMFAVLSMNPAMSEGQWLLVTLTAGVGGSMLSIGSAAGVALMGQARGMYTFFAHLRWTPVIALGYAASILVHFWINAARF
ncbi:MAG: sodium:proton antiporter NhaD [Gammaproteobacteria bacterium]|nr:sodium:proton antiporter NhaD [Gammaproteobacteria bacterium]MCP5135270.1 sodium:proton antiporter NhaD [Gammaproteobacteria bacterium]